MTPNPPLSERRALDLIDTYGADPDRWPESERAPALALIARTPDLQLAMDKALTPGPDARHASSSLAESCPAGCAQGYS